MYSSSLFSSFSGFDFRITEASSGSSFEKNENELTPEALSKGSKMFPILQISFSEQSRTTYNCIFHSSL